MLPIKLRMQAFGAYPDLVEIPFSNLGSSNIYLIAGATGSGKTTIFDAICFALFNASSNSIRGNATFRSHYALDSIESFVEFTFLYKGNIYKIRRTPSYTRKKLRGEGEIQENSQAQIELPDGKLIVGVREVNEYVIELLGLNMEQFSRIALLAQGEFLKLLNSDTQTRSDIFRSIFKTFEFNKFQEKLKEKLSNVKENYNQLNSSIIQLLSLIELDEEYKNKISLYKDSSTIPSFEAVFDEITKKIDIEKNNLNNQKEEFEKMKSEALRFSSMLDKINNKKKVLSELNSIKESLVKLNSDFSETKIQFESIKEKRTNLDNLKKENQFLDIEFKKIDELNQKKKDILDKKTLLDNKKLDIEKLEKNFIDKQELSKKKALEYEDAFNLYLSNQAGILAKNLKDNSPCPVCGSLKHPNPAKYNETDITKEDIDNLKIEVDKLKDELNIHAEKIAGLKAQLNTETISFGDEIKSIDIELSKYDITSMNLKKEEYFNSINEIQNFIDTISKRYEEQSNSFVAYKSKIELLEKNLGEMKDINIDESDDIEHNLVLIKEKYDELDSTIDKLKSRLDSNIKFKNAAINQSKDFKEIEKKYSDYKDLSDYANGNMRGKTKISFEQYIQGYYLDIVLNYANKRFFTITSGQYKLLRKNDIESLQSRNGLDLEIFDFHTSKKRDTKTLSGGESFKAALCLALGLSECASEFSASAKIDSLFIDEGFGSLDSDSLELALSLINELTSTNCLIGIISHVEELKTKIQNQIITVKTNKGSNLQCIF